MRLGALSLRLLREAERVTLFAEFFPEIRFDALDNQIDTLTKGFQALTVSCARCHNHKLDAISTADYYALVEPNKEAFEASLRQQLAYILNTEDTNIQNLRTWAGSIEVSFNLVADSQLDASTQAAALHEVEEGVGVEGVGRLATPRIPSQPPG